MSCEPQFRFPKRPVILAICDICGASLLKSALGRHIEQRHPQSSLAARLRPRPSSTSSKSGQSSGSTEDDPRLGRVFSDRPWQPTWSKSRRSFFRGPLRSDRLDSRVQSPPPRPPSPIRSCVNLTEDLPLIGTSLRCRSPSPSPKVSPGEDLDSLPPPVPVKDMITFDPKATSALAAEFARNQAWEKRVVEGEDEDEDAFISEHPLTPEPSTARVILTARRTKCLKREEGMKEFARADSRSLPINKTDGQVSVISVPMSAALRAPTMVLPCHVRSYLHQELCGLLPESNEEESESEESSEESEEESAVSPLGELSDENPCSSQLEADDSTPGSPLAVAVKEEVGRLSPDLPLVKVERLGNGVKSEAADVMSSFCDPVEECTSRQGVICGLLLLDRPPTKEKTRTATNWNDRESQRTVGVMDRLSNSPEGYSEPGSRVNPLFSTFIEATGDVSEEVSSVCDRIFAVQRERGQGSRILDNHCPQASDPLGDDLGSASPLGLGPGFDDEPLSKMLDETSFFRDPSELEHDRPVVTTAAHSGEVIDGCYFGTCGPAIKTRIKLAKRSQQLRKDLKVPSEDSLTSSSPVRIKSENETVPASPQGTEDEMDVLHDLASPDGVGPSLEVDDDDDDETLCLIDASTSPENVGGGDGNESPTTVEMPIEDDVCSDGSHEELDASNQIAGSVGDGSLATDHDYLASSHRIASIEMDEALDVTVDDSPDEMPRIYAEGDFGDGTVVDASNQTGDCDPLVTNHAADFLTIDDNAGRITYYPATSDSSGVSIPGTSFVILPSTTGRASPPHLDYPYRQSNGTTTQLAASGIREEEDFETKLLTTTIRRMKMRTLQPTNVPTCSSTPSSSTLSLGRLTTMAGPACDRFASVDELLSDLLTEPPDKKSRVSVVDEENGINGDSESSAESSPSQLDEDRTWSQRVQQPGQLRRFQQPVVKPLMTSPSE